MAADDTTDLSKSFVSMRISERNDDLLESSISVPKESRSILQEDSDIQVEFKSILRMIKGMLRVNDVKYICVQKKILSLQKSIGNLLDRHISHIEKKNLEEIVTMLQEVKAEEAIPIMCKLIEVWTKQQEIESTLQEVSSKQQEAIEIIRTIRSKHNIVREKQEEVKTTLEEATEQILATGAKAFPIKVLLWNIGTKDSIVRDFLVPGMVKERIPDVILLQEAPNITVVEINKSERKYEWLKKNTTGILYDNEKYEHIQEFDKVIRVSIQDLVPDLRWKPDKNKEDERTLREVFDTRMRVGCLKIRGSTQKVIFMSFHNGYRNPYVQEGAKVFCKLVFEIQRKTKCFVVGGADLNCQLSTSEKSKYGVVEYQVTDRRSKQKTIDYFVIAPPDTAKKVNALNLIPIDKYTSDQCETALDHDPLVCKLTIHIPNDENESEPKESEPGDKNESEPEMRAKS